MLQASRVCRCCNNVVNESRRIYCSNRCQAEFQYRCYIEDWKAGLESGLQAPYGVSNHIRRYLLEQHGERCQSCGWCERHPKTGKVPLNIDHIDGCWKNCREENLRLLCPNCHSLTLTFGSLNRGNGRAARYEKRPLSSVVERNLGKIEVPSSILGEGFVGLLEEK